MTAFFVAWRSIHIRLAILCISSFLSTTANASPWAMTNDQFLIISYADYFSAEPALPTSPSENVDSRFQRISSNTYAEFGVTDNITIGAKIAYGTSWKNQPTSTNPATGFSELELFTQYQFHRTLNDAASIRITAGRPSNFSSGARPELQSDGVDLDVTLLYGRNLRTKNFKIFATIDTGYRKRLGTGADQIRIQTTLGTEPSKRFMVLLDAFTTLSLGNQQPGGANYDVIKIQPSVLWRITKKWGVQVGVREEIYGRNISLGRTYFVGLWSRF